MSHPAAEWFRHLLSKKDLNGRDLNLQKTRAKIIFLLILTVVFGCSQGGIDTPSNKESPEAAELTISAAISLKDAFDAIGKAFRSATGKKINFNYASSGALQRQIENGAPVDVFASAGGKQMDEVENGGFIDPATRRDVAGNSIVLVVPKDSKLKINEFDDLRTVNVKRIAIGNPKTVPAGQYALESLQTLSLGDELKTKLIFAENVRQVLDYVMRGEVDAGIVYGTDAKSAEANLIQIAIADEESHSPILYPIAIVKESKQTKAAQEFVDFVLSERGQEILRQFGFKAAVRK